MELSPVQVRILGCLVEKEHTTPDNYPLSTNALVNACNQTSNRDPVVSYDETEVDQAVLQLRTEGLARTSTGGRANKHRHVLDEAWGLSPAELGLLAVLFLRGPQTSGELRTRTERIHPFGDLAEVESTLGQMASGESPWVARLERVPGQKERRWVHLCGEENETPSSPIPKIGPSGSATGVGHVDVLDSLTDDRQPSSANRVDDSSIAQLTEEVARLRADVDRLYELLGETPESNE